MIDVVIVHYPSARDLLECVEALRCDDGVVASVVVVDNASPESVPEPVRLYASVVDSPENLGFARAANLGAGRGTADYLLFLNPDVTLTPGTLSALLDSFSDPRVVAASPLLVGADGSQQVGMGGHLPRWRSILSEHLLPSLRLPGGIGRRSVFVRDIGNASRLGGPAKEGQGLWLEWLSGACLMTRRDSFLRVGGFDENFFLYGEDLDLGHRLLTSGCRLLLRTDLTVQHRHASGPERPELSAPETLWLDGLDHYYRKHRPWSRRGFHAVAALGFAARAIAYGLGLARTGDGSADRLLSYARRSAALALAR